MDGTLDLDLLRLFAAVARAGTITGAAAELGMPKQTVSRRVAQLERQLEVTLLHRTTRRLRLTEAGAAFAERCTEIVRLADDAARAVTDRAPEPTGTLRVTADPVLGEAFLPALLAEAATQWPSLAFDVTLTRRRVALVEEGFDVAVRIGDRGGDGVTATELGDARIVYVASPAYLDRRGLPASPASLVDHDCLVVDPDGSSGWPFATRAGVEHRRVTARLRTTSFLVAYRAALDGLGIALAPEFACAADLAAGRLVRVLDPVDVGSIWLLHPAARYLSPRVRAFVDLATARLTETFGATPRSRPR